MKQFLELFNPLPGNHYLHVTTSKNDISNELEKLLSQVDGKLSLALYNNDNLDFSKPFKALPREHDLVIIQDVFSKHKYKDAILKIAYTTLANAAHIIIIEKKGILEISHIKDLLTEHEFRSANEIDVLENYDLIIAKKMHMWGNGL